MCARLFSRIMRSDPQPDATEFWAACNRYRLSEGRFSAVNMALEMHRAMATKEGKSIDMVRIWEGVRVSRPKSCRDQADNSLAQLAIRILSVVVNSGACERCFSSFGVTHTPRRNRLSVQSTHDINFVRMDIEAEHEAAGHTHPRKKRRIGPAASTSTADAGPPPLQTQADVTHSIPIPGDGETSSSIDEFEELLQGTDSLHEPGEETPTSAASHYSKIKLCDLFNFPSDSDASTPLSFYWQGGIADLQAEEAEMDAAAGPPSTS